MEKLLKRKIDSFLVEWKKQSDRMPLIVRGARQIGKTKSILEFAKKNYKSIIEINFALHEEFCDIFDNLGRGRARIAGHQVDTCRQSTQRDRTIAHHVFFSHLFSPCHTPFRRNPDEMKTESQVL